MGGWGGTPCVFHLCRVSPNGVEGVGAVEAANPELQVGRRRERNREGQKSRREGSPDGTRGAVSSLERVRAMWGGGSLFDLRSGGLI